MTKYRVTITKTIEVDAGNELAAYKIATNSTDGWVQRSAVDEVPSTPDMIDTRGEPVSTGMCSDCGTTHFPIHPDSLDQRGEPICTRCAAAGAFDFA